jgi:DNA modification methylase
MILLHGDCLIEMNKIPNHSVDMILCDLPYGTTACKWDVIIPFEPLWEHYWRVLKPNGAIVLFGNQPFTSLLITSQLNKFKYNWTWEKTAVTGFLNAKKEPLRLIEDVCVFYSALPVYNPRMLQGKPYQNKWTSGLETNGQVKNWKDNGYTLSDGLRFPTNILVCSKDKNKLHPTQKPVALLEYLIKTYTNENETVLDNCMGSGSTGVACVNTNRNFIGIEKDDKYFEIASQRIANSYNIFNVNTNDIK